MLTEPNQVDVTQGLPGFNATLFGEIHSENGGETESKAIFTAEMLHKNNSLLWN